MQRDLVTVAYVLLFGLTFLPPALDVVVPFPANVILTATLLVYIGSHLSVDVAEEETEEESLSLKDAALFPIIGSVVLGSLFLAIKFLGPEYVNLVLNFYFFFLGTVAIGASLSPLFARFFHSEVEVPITIPFYGKFSLTIPDIFGGLCGLCFATYYVTTKHYLANNVLGYAFCLQGIERTPLGSYAVGALLLCGLFFYDIYWVFYTPVMVGVAKNIDGPIKLLFPRSLATVDTDATFSMLGLGDIVLPGFFIAFLLRYDAARANAKTADDGRRASYPKTMFNSTLFGYTAGLVATLVVMLKFNHAQPALLYLVPACLGVSLLTAPFAGGFSALFKYSEDTPKPEASTTAGSGGASASDADGATLGADTGGNNGGDGDDTTNKPSGVNAADADATVDVSTNANDVAAAARATANTNDVAAVSSPPVSSGSAGRARRRRRRET